MAFKFSKAELRARKVLDDCGLTDPTELSMDQIILGLKAFYQEKPLKGKEGEIVTVNNRSIITINSDIQLETKKRFVAAHELGHYLMHKDLQPIINDTENDLLSWYQGGTHEIEANEFAAEFLMPSDVFYRSCSGKKFGPDVIEQLSQRYQVSKTATILRFVKRGNHPVFIVYCKDNKMKWWKKSDDFYYYSLFERDQPPPSGTVAYEVFTSGKIYPRDELKQDIWKSDWFRMKDDEQDSKFFEFCLYVKSYNYTISVIWEK
jgi:Zn-dependent peptidase ImmA (M78 family)